MQPREAMPGAMRLPSGARDREKFEALEARVARLERGGASALPVSAPAPVDLSGILARLDALEAKKQPGRPRKGE